MTSTNYRLKETNYTLKNALLWGMCGAHYSQMKRETLWRGKVYHFVIFGMQIFPVVSQIVSLVELGVIKLCFKPAPPIIQTTYPQIQSTEQTASANNTKKASPEKKTPTTDTYDTPRLWPAGLSHLGITDAQKSEMDFHIQNGFKAGMPKITKKKISYVNDQGERVEAMFPISFCTFSSQEGTQIILLPKTILAVGGERNIRWALNLTTGNYFIKKQITGLFEREIMQGFSHWRNKRRGTNDTLFYREVKGVAPKEPKTQVIEPLRDGSLVMMFEEKLLVDFSTKRTLIVDLLEELNYLHGITITGAPFADLEPTRYKRNTNSKIKTIADFGAYHNDIKFDNILVSYLDGRWRAELCDFGTVSSDPTRLGYSIGFSPPETIKFYSTIRPEGISMVLFETPTQVIAYNRKYAQKRDIWSLGLVILAILVGRTVEMSQRVLRSKERFIVDLAPLPCLKRCLTGYTTGNYHEMGVIGLTQKEIDEDLDNLQQEVFRMHPGVVDQVIQYFNLVRGMLQINPHVRKACF